MEKAITEYWCSLVEQLKKDVKVWNKAHQRQPPWDCKLEDDNFWIGKEEFRAFPAKHIQVTLSCEFRNSGEVIARHFGEDLGAVMEPYCIERFQIVVNQDGGAFMRGTEPDRQLQVEDAAREIAEFFLEKWSDGNL
jgi:hypothetical protein